MTTRRRIAVFTGNRAEYGLQYPILKAIAADPRLEYFLLAGGAHLQADFGKTLAEIEADGFQVYRQVDIQMDQDTLFATAQAIGTGILSLSRILDELRPDFLVVYADRFESFSAMITGTQMNIPTAHIEGGDYTEGGALDDSVRHAMTKLAHLHFTTNEQAAERIRRLGEEPWRVFTVGFPALDLVAAGDYACPDEIVSGLGIDPARPVVLFCQHSVTTEFDLAAAQVRPSLEALESLAQDGYQVILTYPNNDAGGRRIIQELLALDARRVPGIQLVSSLGRRRFHGVLNLIGRQGRGAFVGNSSAGIKETPAFGCPAVNIGSRQQGRLRADNVLDVPYDRDAIVHAIRRCVEDEAFRVQCQTCANPYGAGNAGPRIAETLATMPIDDRLLQKKLTY
jgi:UDP-N-acetylglucosamine 2-epimerase (non-hydrolysing)/GDP/UDP-N,N'-diacetylbacillosamine 2-epimerase (hydrolysing)